MNPAMMRTTAVGFLFLLAFALDELKSVRAASYQAAGGRPVARWIGQDGQDFVANNNRREPNDVQDVHIVLSNLDPDREISFIDILYLSGDPAQWQYNVDSFAWKIEVKRQKGSTQADLYIEPSGWEGARDYKMLVRYANGPEHQLILRGRKVNSSLRTAEAALKAKWVGQDGFDRVGTGPEVGPDGLQDARIQVAGVSKKSLIKAVRIDGPGGSKWESGINPQLLPGAEFWADPKTPSEGDLFFHPSRDLNGQTLKVRILYQNDTMDSATVQAGRCDPKLQMPELTTPKVHLATATARWLGQDGQNVNGPGDVHVTVSGLGKLPDLAGAVLTDAMRGAWVYRAAGDEKLKATEEWESNGPLTIRPGAVSGSLDLFFPPSRDETGANLVLRLVSKAGQTLIAQFPGGACDPTRRAPTPAATRTEAKPGDDLQAAVDHGGVVSLAPGTYRLTQPLILNKPTTLTAEQKGATLLFSQPAGPTPWTTAIKIHCGNTTLNGFAVRFEGPIRWNTEVSYGSAVIGTTDDRDPQRHELKVGVAVTNLDLEGPAATAPSKWAEAMRLMRFTNAMSGRIEGNTLKGGPIEFFKGPWVCLNNVCTGTQPGTFSQGVFTGHGTNDMVVRGNRVKPVEPSGKVWRFLVLTQNGANDLVEQNEVEGIGEIAGDGVPRINAPEIILTESYRVSYEGKLRALSDDGLLLRTGRMQGVDVRPGDVVSLLTGPAAGQWRRVAQPLDPTTLLVDAPIPKGTEYVSISRGFVNERFVSNRIDIRGSRTSTCMVLPGNHFGLVVEKNHLLGGAESLGCSACATESPVAWGWSHAPVLGAVFRGNVFEDSETGATLGVSHEPKFVKVNTGRVYMSAVVEDNQIRWTNPFLTRHAGSADKKPLRGVTFGFPHAAHAGEFLVTAARNTLDAPAGRKFGPSLIVHSAELNKQPLLNKNFSLPRKGEADRDKAPSAGGGPPGLRR
ncbi:MAG: hypothetical protein P4L85_27115 [Paludisphaera borealis]|uniref:hypothetical protein n=1 Tax=Paludisphaera borealis TaxID=1387353 RepID=UPI0028419651|nr:hypothetical protein [Paludisphaera borealis]MDR3623053.1 hypothetical protein [Paludisphaera borealis]